MNTSLNSLFSPLQLGALSLRNRIIMAPMTRSRALPGDVPSPMMIDYYRQRASAGIIIAEGAAPSMHGVGYCRTPGIYNAEQVTAWRAITDAVHTEGGLIAIQLMHCGRIGSHFNKAANAQTVAPSTLRAPGQIYTDAAGMQEHDLPRALETAEIPQIIAEYANASRLALEAGFDAIELHCTSGYLPMQFLAENTNQRNDDYGGSPHKRARFIQEVLAAIIDVAGAGRVGLRICPGNPFNGVLDPDPHSTYTALLQSIAPLHPAYLHLIRSPLPDFDAFAFARQHFSGTLILNDGFDAKSASQAVQNGSADAISFGRHFIANPDLVRRMHDHLPLANFDAKTLYTPGAQGYSDYPALP